MVQKFGPLFFVLVLLTVGQFGCGSDPGVPTENNQNNASGVVRGDIDPANAGFEITTETSGDPDHPIPGPFIIRGKNVHYVDSLQVLSVDFTVEHRCRCQFEEPIGLTFINLLPPGVTVENPDNDEYGPGAAIVFEFENDDGVWTPFEESLPRTVHFGVDPGVSIGFVGRIDIAMDERLGSIGGVVWHDSNENGEIDPDEPGIGGVEIYMYRVDGPEISAAEILWRTVTDREGSYRFDGLDAGHYKVERAPRPDLRPTTSMQIDVILVEQDGEVGDFLMANFGCVELEPPPPLIGVGDFVRVWGEFSRAKDDNVRYRFDATEIEVLHCRVDRPAGSDIDPDVFRPCLGLYGRLCGPVTALDAEKHILEVMGTPVAFEVAFDTIPDDSTYYADLVGNGDPSGRECIDFGKIEVGDRVCVDVLRVQTFAEGPSLIGLCIRYFNDDAERIHGPVEGVRAREDGSLAAIRVLGMAVRISESTVIRPIR